MIRKTWTISQIYVVPMLRMHLISREYNNFYEGEFVLYRHTDLPFSVSPSWRVNSMQGSNSRGKVWKITLSWKVTENWPKNKVMEIENILKKFLEKLWKFFTAYRESRTRSSGNSISMGLMQ